MKVQILFIAFVIVRGIDLGNELRDQTSMMKCMIDLIYPKGDYPRNYKVIEDVYMLIYYRQAMGPIRDRIEECLRDVVIAPRKCDKGYVLGADGDCEKHCEGDLTLDRASETCKINKRVDYSINPPSHQYLRVGLFNYPSCPNGFLQEYNVCTASS